MNSHHVLIIQDAYNELHAILSIENNLEEERENWNPEEKIVASFPLNDKLQAIGILANSDDADQPSSLDYQLKELLTKIVNFGASLK
ncbi:MAG: hypothetical protein ACD_7C00205G0002 [uncultured bacterium]|nr:MAG: hypothetical protein ACD_7C00205G0002 [uncultured bacterium]